MQECVKFVQEAVKYMQECVKFVQHVEKTIKKTQNICTLHFYFLYLHILKNKIIWKIKKIKMNNL